MESTYSVSDLTELIAPAVFHPRKPTADEAGLVLRRIRNWTAMGALYPIGALHAGTGKHRRYVQLEARIALILNVLAEDGVSFDALKKVAILVRNLAGGLIAGADQALWQDALSGKQRVFLVQAAFLGPDSQPGATIQFLTTEELFASKTRGFASGVFVDLTDVLRRLPS